MIEGPLRTVGLLVAMNVVVRILQLILEPSNIMEQFFDLLLLLADMARQLAVPSP